MPDNDTNQTQTGATAGTAAASSDAASSQQQGPNTSGAANDTTVDSGTADGTGNSGSSDGGNGAGTGDGDRNRTGRAERKINDLTSKVKELQRQLDDRDNLSQNLQTTKVDSTQVQLPDYSQQTEVTPQQLQKDIVHAAEQIVDIKMGAIAKGLQDQVSRKEGFGNALREIADAKKRYKILNQDDEDHYDQELDETIGNGFYEILKNNPSYSFTDYLKAFKPVLELANQTAGATTGANSGSRNSRGQFANRSGGTSSQRGGKAVEDMTMDELEAHIHAQNR